MRLDHLLSKESSSREHTPPDCSVERLNRGDGFPVGALVTRPGNPGELWRPRSRLLQLRQVVVLCSVLRECFGTHLGVAINAPRASSSRFVAYRSAPGERIAFKSSRQRTPAGSTHQPLENCIASTSIFVLPSYKEPTVDALASTTDERRVWLRKATGSCLESFDPWMSEWGNPAPVMGCYSVLNT